MSLRNKIRELIEVIQDTEINEIEVTSFWGAQKIKLRKKAENVKEVLSHSIKKNKKVKDIQIETEISEEEKDVIENNVEKIKDSEVEETLEESIKDEELVDNDYDIQKAP